MDAQGTFGQDFATNAAKVEAIPHRTFHNNIQHDVIFAIASGILTCSKINGLKW